jgi:integrase
VLGPYRNGKKWRLLVFDQHRQARVFDDRETALRVRERLLIELDGRASRTVGAVVEEFLAYKRKRGCVDSSIRAVQTKLAWLPMAEALNRISPMKAEALYCEQTEKVAAATHHAHLRFTKALFKWCVKQKYIDGNPFADVQPIGRAKRGKLQLRQDEAKTLSAHLIDRASSGHFHALALMVQVLLGLRSSEVLKLRKRDLDCGGTQVVIEGTKNENAKRTVELKDAPIVMELLARRVASLAPEALIFAPEGQARPLSNTTLHKALWRFCKRAGVPLVCPHSLRGLHSSLAVQAGATCSLVAQALGHGSDSVTKRHYIAPSALSSARSARVASALLGTPDIDSLITTLRNLPQAQLDEVCSSVGYHR